MHRVVQQASQVSQPTSLLKRGGLGRGVILVVSLWLGQSELVACPFCISESRTLTEEMTDSSVVLLARLVEPAEAGDALQRGGVPAGLVDPETGAARFTVVEVLKGQDLMRDVDEIRAIYFGEANFDQSYFVRGLGEPPEWNIPMGLSKLAAAYVPRLFDLPESGADRLEFFQAYLEHEDPLLAQDAYDEFARAPYQDVIDLRDRMDRSQLVAWIESPRTSPSRKRLHLTMLGVCGAEDDLLKVRSMLTADVRALGPAADASVAASLVAGGPWSVALLGEVTRMGDRQQKLGLDALIACYLTLQGKEGDVSEGLDLIDERFLLDPDADYSHVYASLMAIRFLAEEQRDKVPLERVLASARLLLDSPDFADQVIPDLARWEDWSVLDRLVTMYLNSTDPEANQYIREPIVTYLDVASEQSSEVGSRATEALAQIEPIDPDAVRRARSLQAFGFLAQARAKQAETPSPSPSVEPIPEPQLPATTSLPEEPAKPVEEVDRAVSDLPIPKPVPAPPRRWVLLLAPLLAVALCTGLLWWIFRSGAE